MFLSSARWIKRYRLKTFFFFFSLTEKESLSYALLTAATFTTVSRNSIKIRVLILLSDSHMCLSSAGVGVGGWGQMPQTTSTSTLLCRRGGLKADRVTGLRVRAEAGSRACTVLHCLQTPFCSHWDWLTLGCTKMCKHIETNCIIIFYARSTYVRLLAP